MTEDQAVKRLAWEMIEALHDMTKEGLLTQLEWQVDRGFPDFDGFKPYYRGIETTTVRVEFDPHRVAWWLLNNRERFTKVHEEQAQIETALKLPSGEE